MIYIFQKAYTLKDGSKIKKGDAVFIDNPNEDNEVTKAVEADKGTEVKKKKEHTK